MYTLPHTLFLELATFEGGGVSLRNHCIDCLLRARKSKKMSYRKGRRTKRGTAENTFTAVEPLLRR